MNLFKGCFLLIFLFSWTCCTAAQHACKKNENIKTINNYASADSLPISCSKSDEIEKIIDDAISLGAPIYNEGLHMACYRIYEWAAYKIIYVYGTTCKNVETVLKTAIEKSHGDYSDTEKAWIMRASFDKILGVPTQTKEEEKESLLKKGSNLFYFN